MKITAIVVTYNRLLLLQKCIKAIAQQTHATQDVIVINNGSTDGTTQWLADNKINHVTLENKGGAAGFKKGIELAYADGADWVWMMDDDSIPTPTALEELLNAIQVFTPHLSQIGFFSSTVLWTDGSLHKMNKPYLLEKDVPSFFDMVDSAVYKPLSSSTFVSLLLSRLAIEKTGLPLKEFFIWCDDIEYTRRIVEKKFYGVFVTNSIVVHETPVNYNNNIYKDSAKNLWKYKHGIRNELYMRRMYKSEGSFYRNVLKHIFVAPIKIIAKRKNSRWPFIKMMWQASIASLNFKPKIEHIKANDTHSIK